MSGKPAARISDRTAHGGTISTGEPTVRINNRPAARLTDDHTCPGHGGGQLVPPCASSVLIGNRPAARVGDRHRCACGRPDPIVTGDATVLIGGPAPSGSGAAAVEAVLGLVSGRASGSGSGGFTTASADAMIWSRWGSLLPAGVPQSLAQRTARFVSQEQITEAVIAEAERYFNEQGIPLSEADRAELEAHARRVRGYAVPGGNITLPEGTTDPGLVLHESLHRYSHSSWIEQVQRRGLSGHVGGVILNEGMTEMLTRQALQALDVRGFPDYDDYVRRAEELACVVGQDTLERAYFSGDVESLERAVDQAGGRGSWEYLMRTGNLPW